MNDVWSFPLTETCPKEGVDGKSFLPNRLVVWVESGRHGGVYVVRSEQWPSTGCSVSECERRDLRGVGGVRYASPQS